MNWTCQPHLSSHYKYRKRWKLEELPSKDVNIANYMLFEDAVITRIDLKYDGTRVCTYYHHDLDCDKPIITIVRVGYLQNWGERQGKMNKAPMIKKHEYYFHDESMQSTELVEDVYITTAGNFNNKPLFFTIGLSVWTASSPSVQPPCVKLKMDTYEKGQRRARMVVILQRSLGWIHTS